jgi:hypothetical protein
MMGAQLWSEVVHIESMDWGPMGGHDGDVSRRGYGGNGKASMEAGIGTKIILTKTVIGTPRIRV